MLILTTLSFILNGLKIQSILDYFRASHYFMPTLNTFITGWKKAKTYTIFIQVEVDILFF